MPDKSDLLLSVSLFLLTRKVSLQYSQFLLLLLQESIVLATAHQFRSTLYFICFGTQNGDEIVTNSSLPIYPIAETHFINLVFLEIYLTCHESETLRATSGSLTKLNNSNHSPWRSWADWGSPSSRSPCCCTPKTVFIIIYFIDNQFSKIEP